MIHPHGAEVSSEEVAGTVFVVVVVDWPVSAATAAPNRASTRLITPAFGSVVVVVGAVVVGVVVVGAAVVVVAGLLVVVLGGLLVVVVDASAMAEVSELAVLVVVLPNADSLVVAGAGGQLTGRARDGL